VLTMSRRQFCGATLLGLIGPQLRAEGQASLRIGMVQSMFRDVQPAMVQAMSRPLRDLIQRQTGLSGDVEVVADSFLLSDRLIKKEFQLGVFHGFEFAWARKHSAELVPLVVTIPPGRNLQASVVVHKDCKHTALSDMKDEQVLIPRGTRAHCLLYLDRQRAKFTSTTAAPKTKPLVTTEEAIDSVIQGDAVAALVDAPALAGYQNLQPGAFNQLRMLSKSETFPPTVIAYNKTAVDAVTLEKVRKLLTEAHQTPAGKPLMMLWNLKGFEDVPADYTEQLDRIAKAYPAVATQPITTAISPQK